ncbi:EthD domain-containing protein [Burkholderia plantarii]|uniref:EthD domain-containing protein n=1 Tax=Burkholderia plantarii TaxID=41899 RepID=UPI0006D8AFA7|nr:EthD domain-containing protein [Burkholderia plantarii]ALK33563.1 Phthalate 4,5-dioxygenase [Burkholderia plantarii]GLZ23210.1 hypothetical protein Bpla01_67380 [Burkholderia plantarii]
MLQQRMTRARTMRVASKTSEALDIFSFELVDAAGEPLPAFSAGSHLDVYTPAGPIRQYSLCNDPRESNRYLIAVLRDPASRGGSVAMHSMEVGQTLKISDPKNYFPLVHDARSSILFAGGIGITPILCMAEHLAASGADFMLHYCTRSAERTAFADRIARSAFRERVFFYHDDGPSNRRLDAQAAVGKFALGRHLYVCGSTEFMEWILDAARGLGWPENHLHREYFATAPTRTDEDDTLGISKASTGHVISPDKNQSVVAEFAMSGEAEALGAARGTCAQPTTSPHAELHPDLALKLIIVGRRRPGTTLADHRRHMRRVHGELVVQNIAADPTNAPRRYVQNPVFDGTFRATDTGAADPFALNRDFVTQIWFPDMASLMRARQSAFYMEKVKHDEDNFVDQASVVFMPVRERVIAGAAAPATQHVKLFGFLQRSPGATPEDFRRAWDTAPWAVAGYTGVLRYTQNDTLPTPTGLPLVDGIDEFWFDDEADARIFLACWQAWVSEALVCPGLAPKGRHFVLLVHEDVIHAGPR